MPVIQVSKLAAHIEATVRAIKEGVDLLIKNKINAELPDTVQFSVTVITDDGAGAVRRLQKTGESTDIVEQVQDESVTESTTTESKTNSGGDKQTTNYFYESDA